MVFDGAGRGFPAAGLLVGLILPLPAPAETLHYRAEWRLMHAGDAALTFSEDGAKLTLQSAGVVESLYRIRDDYRVSFDRDYCAGSAWMHAEEGRKRLETKVNYRARPGKAETVETDLRRSVVVHQGEVDVPPCVHDVLAGLGWLRRHPLDPGQFLELPISSGKKTASVRVNALNRDRVKTAAGTFATIRHEAFLFNNVIYRRKARLFVWLSDDARRLPVQVRLQMPFYLGTVTLELAKEEP